MTDARRLYGDQRGAIMLLGLFMACFLIGGLWFLIGIGDAIVFRDTMQEATDHAAFTSAVLHAKGMNFLSACNLVLLALIAIHLIMGLIHDILLAICIVGAFFSAGTACVPWTNWRPYYTKYGKAMKQVADAIHLLEEGAAVGYPFLGAAKAYTLGRDYGGFTKKKRKLDIIAVSTSMVPGNAMSSLVNTIFRQKAPEKLGDGAHGPTRPGTAGHSEGKKSFLPVEAKHYDTICKRMSAVILGSLAELTGWGSFVDNQVFKGMLAQGIVARYCNDLSSGSGKGTAMGNVDKGNDQIEADNRYNQRSRWLGGGGGSQPVIEKVGGGTQDSGSGNGNSSSDSIDPGFDAWWGKDGPMVPWSGTLNGSAWQQIWAINVSPEFTDDQQSRVHLATNKQRVASNAKVWAYLAQAEFYFDCNKSWFESECGLDDNAGYAIKWRARLRRLQLPQIGSLLSGMGGEFLQNMTAYKDLKGALGGYAGDFGKSIGVRGLSGAMDGLIKEFEIQVRSKILGPGGAAIDGAINGLTGNLGVYH